MIKCFIGMFFLYIFPYVSYNESISGSCGCHLSGKRDTNTDNRFILILIGNICVDVDKLKEYIIFSSLYNGFWGTVQILKNRFIWIPQRYEISKFNQFMSRDQIEVSFVRIYITLENNLEIKHDWTNDCMHYFFDFA